MFHVKKAGFAKHSLEKIRWLSCDDYVPHRRGGGHIVFDADPVGVAVSVTLSCLHNIS